MAGLQAAHDDVQRLRQLVAERLVAPAGADLQEGDGQDRPAEDQAPDLRVRLVKCAESEAEMTVPRFPALKPPLKRAADLLQYGARFRKARERR